MRKKGGGGAGHTKAEDEDETIERGGYLASGDAGHTTCHRCQPGPKINKKTLERVLCAWGSSDVVVER
jgi:hypothetical protein